MMHLLQDLRFALRQLRRAPGFAVTAVLTLALGMAAAIATFSVVRSTLLQPLPYPRPDELVGIDFSRPGSQPYDEQTGETADFVLAHARSFNSLGVADDGAGGVNFSAGAGTPQALRAIRVSSGYLPALGISPLLGRTFTAQEDRPGAAPVILLSEALWRGALGSDPHVLGRLVHVNGDPYTVVGVMSTSFATVDAPDLWAPLKLSPSDAGYQGDNYQMIGRLRSGVTITEAGAEMATMTAALYRQFPGYAHWGPPGAPTMGERVWPLQRVVTSSVRGSLLALAAAVGAVLLLACLNLAGLMIARHARRQHELAVMTSLGAERGRLLRLLMTESTLLAVAGSGAGIALADAVLPALLRYAPISLPNLHVPKLDSHVVLFAALAGVGVMLLTGLLPALARLQQGSLSTQRSAAGESVSAHRLGRGLLIGQVALTTMLLSVSAFMLGTFLNLRAVPSGVRPQHLYAVQVNLKGSGFASAAHSARFVSAVEERLQRLPGVQQVAATNGLPLDGGLNMQGGPAGRSDLKGITQWRFVTAAYLATSGTALLRGQNFSGDETSRSEPVALINEYAARHWFAGASPIGASVDDGEGRAKRVIGVVANVRPHALAEQDSPMVYVPYTQMEDSTTKMINGWFPTTFLLRTRDSAGADPAALAKAAQREIASVDGRVPVSKFISMEGLILKGVAAPRFYSWLSTAFAAFALSLAMLGLFGLLSYQVAGRTREFGVRMALGAQRSQVLVLVAARGLRWTCAGLLIGTLGSILLRGAVVSFLAETIRSDDPSLAGLLANPWLTLFASATTMLLAATAAALLPARRAASVDPVVALRSE